MGRASRSAVPAASAATDRARAAHGRLSPGARLRPMLLALYLVGEADPREVSIETVHDVLDIRLGNDRYSADHSPSDAFV